MLRTDDFDGFLASFRCLCPDEELDYLTDLLFLQAQPQPPGTEKRFKGGLVVWIVSALMKCLMVPRGIDSATSARRPPQGFAFFILPTNAHQGSLLPILEELDAHSATFYSQAPDNAPGAPFVDCSLLANLRAMGRLHRFLALAKAIRISRRAMRVVRRIPGFLDGARGDFHARLAEFVLRIESTYRCLCVSHAAHRAVFVTYEVIPECKAVVRWARERGMRIIHVMHGQRLSTYQVTRATDLLLFGKPDEPWFKPRVPANTRIWTIGHPRLEWVRRQVGPVLNLTAGRRPRIAFFSQPAEKDYTREMRLADWKTLSGLKDQAELRIRLHPRENREAALRDLTEIGVDFAELSDAGLIDDLAWCDGIASSWSTVSVEAAACGRAVFWTCASPELYDAPEALRNEGIGVLIRSSNEWHAWLDQFENGAWLAPAGVNEEKIRNLGFVGDSNRPWVERLDLV